MKMLKKTQTVKNYFKTDDDIIFNKMINKYNKYMFSSEFVDFNYYIDQANKIIRIDKKIKSVDWYGDDMQDNVLNLKNFEKFKHEFGKYFIYNFDKVKKSTGSLL